MICDLGDRLFAQYGNHRVVDGAEEIGSAVLRKYGARIDSFDEYEIIVVLLDRGYLTDDTLRELKEDYIADCEETGDDPNNFFCEEMNWTVTNSVTIELDDGVITGITCEDRAWGGDCLGDYDPEEIYTSEELDCIERAAYSFMDAITNSAN